MGHGHVVILLDVPDRSANSRVRATGSESHAVQNDAEVGDFQRSQLSSGYRRYSEVSISDLPVFERDVASNPLLENERVSCGRSFLKILRLLGTILVQTTK